MSEAKTADTGESTFGHLVILHPMEDFELRTESFTVGLSAGVSCDVPSSSCPVGARPILWHVANAAYSITPWNDFALGVGYNIDLRSAC